MPLWFHARGPHATAQGRNPLRRGVCAHARPAARFEGAPVDSTAMKPARDCIPGALLGVAEECAGSQRRRSHKLPQEPAEGGEERKMRAAAEGGAHNRFFPLAGTTCRWHAWQQVKRHRAEKACIQDSLVPRTAALQQQGWSQRRAPALVCCVMKKLGGAVGRSPRNDALPQHRPRSHPTAPPSSAAPAQGQATMQAKDLCCPRQQESVGRRSLVLQPAPERMKCFPAESQIFKGRGWRARGGPAPGGAHLLAVEGQGCSQQVLPGANCACGGG